MSMGRLVVRSDIQPDESLPGLLTRLAEYNGLDSPVRILRHVGLGPGFEKTSADLSHLAQFIGVARSSLEAASFAPLNAGATHLLFGGMRVSRNHISTSGDRVCPLCIETGGYSRRLWHLRAYVACHHHEVVLTDSCRKCDAAISPLRSTLGRCACGEPFQIGPEATRREMQLAALLADAANGSSSLPLESGHLEGACTLTWYFGLADQPDVAPNLEALSGRTSVEVARAIIERGAPFAYAWRPTFLAWAETRFGGEAGVGIHRNLGGELQRLRRSFEDTCPFILTELRTYLSTTWQGFMLRRGSFFCTAPEKPRFLTISQASKLLGVSPRSLRKLVKSGLVSAVEGPPSKRRYLAIRSDGMETIRRYIADLLTPERAGLEFGISARRIGDLARAGLIIPVLRVSKKPRFDAAQLRRFCTGLASPMSMPSELVSITSTKAIRFIYLIRMIHDGRLAACFGSSMSTSFDNLFVEKSALERARFGDHSGSQSISTFRACDRLGLDNRTLVAFVRKLGLQAKWQGGSLVAIAERDVEKWEGRLTTSGRIGAGLGLSGAAVSRRLKQLGFAPLSPSNSPAKVSAIWLKAEIEHVDFSSQWLTARGRLCHPAAGGRMRLVDTRAGPTIGPQDVSLVELQRSVHINRTTLALLARAGFLMPGGLTSAGHLRGVSRESAERFDQEYVSSTAISRRHGISAISVTRRILATGVTPILEGHSSARYQFCWRRSDIEKIDFQCRLRNRHGRRHNAPKLDYVDLTLRESETDGSAVVTRLALTFLGTNAASLRVAIDNGLLAAARISAKGSVIALHAREVRQFAVQYAYTPKLSSELGISENALLKTLKLRGAVPVLPGRAPVQALWRRAGLDLTDLLGLNAVQHEAESEPTSLLLWT